MAEQKRPATSVQVELGEKESEGIYSNFVIISFSASEFIFDFARILPGAQKAKVFARIVTTPQHARLLQNALNDNIKKYEDKFEKIKVMGKDNREIGF
ncbi:hypothetical protein AMJ39_07540 [candidate division TA06 bacterium DG_24]|jgi:hypothetical protein|uniref:DUF3467 domain-containing protein n=2 Tax=Bacteria division TA06 TaxID=1156500 RepID=A0A0S8JMW1_UNCT6|nr:MAG: hypothetical protein AMJ39_07540 [candidate division TA06 bacterium DG_24]KPL10125.1 MAG: hypothetical protein AMJ71_04340 [candidate division TA06 bacterium SM1_40]